MQFRVSDNKRRVQCLAAIYDKDSKRTRQKLVWTIDHYDPCQQRPAPHALAAAGTIEQREQWSSDIAQYLDELDERGRLNKLRSGIAIVANVMATITDDLSRQTPKLTEQERQQVSALVLSWAEALNILPPPVKSRQAERAPTGPRSKLIKEAQRLRDAGHSIRGVVEAMKAAGNKVSRSWVQEQTSRP